MKKVIRETASTADTDPENYIGPEVDPDTGDVLCKNGKKPGADGCADSEDDSEHVDRIKDKTREPESILREWQDFGIDARGNVVHRFGVTRDEVESARTSGSKSGLLISDSYLGLIGAGLMEAHEIDILEDSRRTRTAYGKAERKDIHKGIMTSDGLMTAKGWAKDASSSARYAANRAATPRDAELEKLNAIDNAKDALSKSPKRPAKPGDIKTLTHGAVDEAYGSVSDQLAASASAQKKKDIHKRLLTPDGKPTVKRFVKDASSFIRKSKDPDNTEAGSAIAKFDAHDRANMALDASPNRKRKASDMSTLVKEAHEIDILEDSRRNRNNRVDATYGKAIHKGTMDPDGNTTTKGWAKLAASAGRHANRKKDPNPYDTEIAYDNAQDALSKSPNRPKKPGDIETLTRGAVKEADEIDILGEEEDSNPPAPKVRKPRAKAKEMSPEELQAARNAHWQQQRASGELAKNSEERLTNAIFAKFGLGEDSKNPNYDTRMISQTTADDSLDTIATFAHMRTGAEINPKKPVPVSDLKKKPAFTPPKTKSPTGDEFHLQHADSGEYVAPLGKTTTDPSQASVRSLSGAITTGRQKQTVATAAGGEKPKFKVVAAGGDTKKPAYVVDQKTPDTNVIAEVDQLLSEDSRRTRTDGADRKQVHKGLINPSRDAGMSFSTAKGAVKYASGRGRVGIQQQQRQMADEGDPLADTSAVSASNRSAERALARSPNRARKPGDMEILTRGAVKEEAHEIDFFAEADHKQYPTGSFEKMVARQTADRNKGMHKGLQDDNGMLTLKGTVKNAGAWGRQEVSGQFPQTTMPKGAAAVALNKAGRFPRPGDIETLTRGAVKEETEVKTLQENSPLVRHMTSLETGLWMKEASDEKKKKKKEDDDEKEKMSKSEVADGIQKQKKEITKVLETYYAASGDFLDEEEVFHSIEALSEELGSNLSSGRAFDVKPNAKPGLKLMFKDHTSSKRIGKG